MNRPINKWKWHRLKIAILKFKVSFIFYRDFIAMEEEETKGLQQYNLLASTASSEPFEAAEVSTSSMLASPLQRLSDLARGDCKFDHTLESS